MPHANLRKRLQGLVSVTILLLLLAAAVAFADKQLIEAEEGGVVNIASGADLVIPPKALKEDTIVSAYMEEGSELVTFTFGPDDLRFSKPAMLYISLSLIDALGNIDDLTLYGEDGKKLKPKLTQGILEYRIKHFSLYYYRRR